MYLERDVVTLNDYGLVGVFNSYGDNVVSGNVTCDVCDATVTGVGLE